MHFRRRKNAHFSELIGEIYDAARDPSLWSEVGGGAGRFIGGSTAAIFSKDPVAGSGNVYETAIDPHHRSSIAMNMQTALFRRPAIGALKPDT
jgi:hypothetical protein